MIHSARLARPATFHPERLYGTMLATALVGTTVYSISAHRNDNYSFMDLGIAGGALVTAGLAHRSYDKSLLAKVAKNAAAGVAVGSLAGAALGYLAASGIEAKNSKPA